MVSRTAQGLLSLEARKLCVWSLSASPLSPGTAVRRTGELRFDVSAVSLELGDSDRPQQTQRTEEFVVVFTARITILSDVSRLISGLLFFPCSGFKA